MEEQQVENTEEHLKLLLVKKAMSTDEGWMSLARASIRSGTDNLFRFFRKMSANDEQYEFLVSRLNEYRMLVEILGE
jgi:hypothetical protein